MRYPYVVWAAKRLHIPQFELALFAKMGEARLSRALAGFVELTPTQREQIAVSLGYPQDWLFQEVQPPARVMPLRPGYETAAVR